MYPSNLPQSNKTEMKYTKFPFSFAKAIQLETYKPKTSGSYARNSRTTIQQAS